MRTGLFFFMIMLAFTASPASGDSMRTGRQTSQPIGHYEFCKALPAECAIRPMDTRLLTLTPAMWGKIAQVNSDVNAAIYGENDLKIYGLPEVWIYPTNGRGDCEDYALLKRRLLHKAGISLANLLVTVVRKPDNEGHAVLTVRTDHGDFILDNLETRVLPWRQTGYKFLKRQASYHTGRWTSLLFRENNLLLTANIKK